MAKTSTKITVRDLDGKVLRYEQPAKNKRRPPQQMRGLKWNRENWMTDEQYAMCLEAYKKMG